VKELPLEIRALLAFGLSILVLVLWGVFFRQAAPPRTPQQPVPAATPVPVPATPVPQAPAVSPAAKAEAVEAKEERTYVVENDLYRVELSNRGAVARRWELKRYRDDSKPTPKVLDLVHPEAAQQFGWPLAIVLEDEAREKQANSALFEVAVAGPSTSVGARTNLVAPGELSFRWSDGRLTVTKRVRFDSGYVVEVESTAALDGQMLPHGLAWRGGFGDATVYRGAEQVKVFYRTSDKLHSLEVRNVGLPDHPEQRRRESGVLFGGITDRYFAAAFLPPADTAGPGLAVWHWRGERQFQRDNETVKEPVVEMAAGTTTPAALATRLYVGPKELETLGRLRPPLNELVDFGWFGFIAAPLFYFLKWLHKYVANYGWAIVLMTVMINMALFPLKVQSFRAMKKLQRIMPEMKQIREKYKKYPLRDPRKQQENKELMALYQREGINPLTMGGCLPMLLQMPIWIALYQMLNGAIELRHAQWLGWIRDLSAPDPYYILPVTMAATMYIMQKTTPTTATDPIQQRMISLMPLMFGAMFVIFPVSSGLVLYILTSNLVGMGQQWFLNRTAAKEEGRPRGKKKKVAAGPGKGA